MEPQSIAEQTNTLRDHVPKAVGVRPESVRARTDVAWACIFAVLVSGLFTTASFILWVSIIVLAAPVVLAPKNLQMQAVDWGVLLVAAFEIVMLPFSQYSANSIRASVGIVLSSLMFLAIRLTIRKSIQVAFLSGALGVCAAWLGLSAFAQFALEARHLARAGFSDLLAFRSRLVTPPLPWVAGEWFTVVLLLLPFACALPLCLWQQGKRWPTVAALLPPLIVTAALTISLSRAVFWSTVLFYASGCAFLVLSKAMSLRTGGVALGGALGMLLLLLACESAFYPGVIKTYGGQHASQTRSTHGRVAIWSRSTELVRAHPLLGVGSSNAALMLLSSADEEETTGFASRTFSLPVQILVEKGIVGFLLYTVLLLFVAREFLQTIRDPPRISEPKKKNGKARDPVAKPPGTAAMADSNSDSAYKVMACCFAAGLVAALFRELTYSSLMEHSLTMVLVAALAALVCRPEMAQNNT